MYRKACPRKDKLWSTGGSLTPEVGDLLVSVLNSTAQADDCALVIVFLGPVSRETLFL